LFFSSPKVKPTYLQATLQPFLHFLCFTLSLHSKFQFDHWTALWLVVDFQQSTVQSSLHLILIFIILHH
jgi:hypothetical protein